MPPKPWRVAEAELDIRPGGRFNTVFAGPNGERHDNNGAYLDVIPMKRLVFTDAYSEDYMPSEKHFMTGYVDLSDAPEGKTRMVWGARHGNEEDQKTHLDMGFAEGWQSAARQLEELAGALPRNGSRVCKKSCASACGSRKAALKPPSSTYRCLPDSFIEATFQNGAPGEPMIVEFTLAGEPYMILNGGPHYKLNPAASISVLTKSQTETDALWEALLKGGGEEMRCGRLVDRFGVSWQIVPEALSRLANAEDAAAASRAVAAMMQMNKIDIAALERAFQG